jgi:hypothetical protein
VAAVKARSREAATAARSWIVAMASTRSAAATPAAEAMVVVSRSVARGVAMTKAWVRVDLGRIRSEGPDLGQMGAIVIDPGS